MSLFQGLIPILFYSKPPLAIFIDLSKAFDCLNYDLLNTKQEAHGFTRKALNIIYSFLNSRKQRVKVKWILQ